MKRRIAALSFVVSLLFLTSTAFATDRHVPGTYPTIQAGIDAAEPGDTVIVAAGAVGLALDPCSATLFVTYEESNVIEMVNAKTMISEQKPLTIYGISNLAGIVVDQTKQKTTKRVVFLFNSRRLSAIIKNWSD